MSQGSTGFSGVLANGNGRVVFDPGATVVILLTTSTNAYFVQGYLAHP